MPGSAGYGSPGADISPQTFAPIPPRGWVRWVGVDSPDDVADQPAIVPADRSSLAARLHHFRRFQYSICRRRSSAASFVG